MPSDNEKRGIEIKISNYLINKYPVLDDYKYKKKGSKKTLYKCKAYGKKKGQYDEILKIITNKQDKDVYNSYITVNPEIINKVKLNEVTDDLEVNKDDKVDKVKKKKVSKVKVEIIDKDKDKEVILNLNGGHIDKELLNFTKCDVFTPDKISKIMGSFLNNIGNLLEPACGDGQLLKYLKLNNYDKIDLYDIKEEYLNKCPNNNNITKYLDDFIMKEINIKYNNIILNPPYIKIQDLSTDYINYIKNKWPSLTNGNIDIYSAFILKCLDVLDDNGIMVSINPNSYLYNKCCINLRKYLIENKLIKEIIDFKSEKVFENVSTYTCITIFTKEPKDYLIYNGEKIFYNEISKKEYNIFIKENTDKNIKTLDDICSIRNGIATLRDKIYIHKEQIFNEPCWKKITNGEKYSWCIFPYDKDAKLIEENKFKLDNPLSYEFLEKNKIELSKRDRGKKTYPNWFAYGRTQALTISKNDKVMYVSTLSDPENIKYKIDDNMLFIGCLRIDLKTDEYTLEKIKQILENNKDFIINNSSKRAGGWLNISGRILKQIPIE